MWLCLNCQIQQTSGRPRQPETSRPASQRNVGTSVTATSAKEDSAGTEASPKQTSAWQEPSLSSLPQASVSETRTTAERSEEKKPSKVQLTNEPSAANKQTFVSTETNQLNRSENAEPPKQDSSFFGFGFPGMRSQSPSHSASTSVSGKVLQFGSSVLGSTSSLISSSSSSTQEKPSMTPPTSRKGSVQASANPTPQRAQDLASTETKEEEKKPIDVSESSRSNLAENCQLCKEEDPTTLNICSSCKSTFCIRCDSGPHDAKVKR